jgi:hypothetical protein
MKGTIIDGITDVTCGRHFFFSDLHTHNTHTHTHTYTHTHRHTLMSAWIASTSVVSSSLVLSYVIHITVLHLVLYKGCLFFFGAFFFGKPARARVHRLSYTTDCGELVDAKNVECNVIQYFVYA